MIIFYISHLFSPGGRAGGSHMLRYQGRSIVYYRFDLKCLAYGSLQLVQNLGIKSKMWILKRFVLQQKYRGHAVYI